MLLRTKLLIVVLFASTSVLLGLATMVYQGGIDAVSMQRDGVQYVKTAQAGWVLASSPLAPSVVDGNPEGYDWDLSTIPFELPWTSGNCGEDSGIACE